MYVPVSLLCAWWNNTRTRTCLPSVIYTDTYDDGNTMKRRRCGRGAVRQNSRPSVNQRPEARRPTPPPTVRHTAAATPGPVRRHAVIDGRNGTRGSRKPHRNLTVWQVEGVAPGGSVCCMFRQRRALPSDRVGNAAQRCRLPVAAVKRTLTHNVP